MNRRRQMAYFLYLARTKTEKFIKKLYHNTLLQVKSYIKNVHPWQKLGMLTRYLAEVAFTGYIIYYSLTHFNWISCGILSALAVYYIEWFVKLIKRKENI